MKVPLEISARNFTLTDEMEDFIREKAGKLDTFYDGIIGCRIMVEVPHRSQRKGLQYHVRIDMTVPGGELVVKREPADDVHVAIVKAFDIAERQIKEFAEKQRGDVKIHMGKPVARVARLFPEQGYGFLTTSDGREIYFHENSVLDGRFEELGVGMLVSFVEQLGEEGVQASSVSIE